MSFNDLEEFFDSSLRLPIGGREYTVPSPDGETGLYVQRVIALGAKSRRGEEITEEQAARIQLDDEEERSLHERLLGTAFEDMLEDGVDWEKIKLAGNTAMIWVGFGIEAAEQFWNAGGSPEASAPNREARRAQSRETPAVARSTPRRGSGSGTRSRSSRAPRTIKGQVTDGSTSSVTGS